jgi:hypothetical protein
MFFKPTIWKKLTASCLMLLFLVVLGTKAFHAHHIELSQVEGVVLSSPTSNCGICEFQLTKEAELPGQTDTERPFAYAIYPAPVPETVFVDTHFHVYPERGPPAV